MAAVIEISSRDFNAERGHRWLEDYSISGAKPKNAWLRFFASHSIDTARKFSFAQKINNSLLEKIQELAELEDGWDGEGAAGVDLDAIKAAKIAMSFLADAVPTPSFSPNVNGTVSFYWCWLNGSAELEIGKTRYSWVVIEDVFGHQRITHASGSNMLLSRPEGLADLARALNPAGMLPATSPISAITFLNSWTDNLFSF